MMKNFLKRLSSLALAVLLMAALAVPAAAASTVTFDKAGSKNSATVGDGTMYHATDLFANFKNVMPGDSRTETITVYNKVPGSSYITVCIQAVPHTDGSYDATLNGKDPTAMNDFLGQMTMTVTRGNKTIYSGPANKGWEMDKSNGVKINYKRSADLTVTLNVPITMGNEFQNHLGEIDWIIKADIVEGKNLIQTGQLNWPIPVLGTLGCGLIFLGFWMNRKKKKDA